MTDAPLVSVLIVNWHSGAMARGLVRNLRRQRLPGRAPDTGLEFIVTDNASGPDEEVHLAALEADGVSVIRSAQNSGYGMGMNMAAQRARGEFVLIVNPDVMAFRGALAGLVNHLRENGSCGAAGPKSYLDAQRFFWLPPTELPSLCDLVSETLARAWRPYARLHARGRSRRALAHWTMLAPTPETQLSGHAIMMKRALALELGPFDPAYPLYFEDADLCLRLHRRGFTTEVVPRVSMVHFFNRSALRDPHGSMSRFEVSRRLFFRRRYGRLGAFLARVLTGYTARAHGRGHLFAPIEDLGERARVPALDVPGSGAYLAEISSDPGFVFAAGRLDVGRTFRIPDVVWDGLADATYYVRFLERRSLDVLRTVAIRKVGGSQPIDADVASSELVHA